MQKLRKRSSGISEIRFSKLPAVFDARREGEHEKGRIDIDGTLARSCALSVPWKHRRMSRNGHLRHPLSMNREVEDADFEQKICGAVGMLGFRAWHSGVTTSTLRIQIQT